MMKIQDLKVIYICPEHNEKYRKRKAHMQQLLEKIGFKEVIHFKSSAAKYPQCLTLANIEILTTYNTEPILLLEDDVEFTGVDTFDYVPDADAIYFGISRSGGHPYLNTHQGGCKVEPYSLSQVRVLNMLTTHAILYISTRYKNAVIEQLKRNLPNHSDVMISRLQPHFKVLANKAPSFYQAAHLNNGNHNIQKHTLIVFK
jgi:hypothetical protein